MAREISPSTGCGASGRCRRAYCLSCCAPRWAATASCARAGTPTAPRALLRRRQRRQALCGLLAGVADQLGGRLRRPAAGSRTRARRAAVPAPLVHALCLSQLALLAIDASDWEAAARLSTRARSQIARYGLTRYPTAALVLAVSGLVRAQRGRVDDAGEDVREAAVLLERVTDLAPWYELEVQLVLARAALRLSDVNGARTRLARRRAGSPRGCRMRRRSSAGSGRRGRPRRRSPRGAALPRR